MHTRRTSTGIVCIAAPQNSSRTDRATYEVGPDSCAGAALGWYQDQGVRARRRRSPCLGSSPPPGSSIGGETLEWRTISLRGGPASSRRTGERTVWRAACSRSDPSEMGLGPGYRRARTPREASHRVGGCSCAMIWTKSGWCCERWGGGCMGVLDISYYCDLSASRKWSSGWAKRANEDDANERASGEDVRYEREKRKT